MNIVKITKIEPKTLKLPDIFKGLEGTKKGKLFKAIYDWAFKDQDFSSLRPLLHYLEINLKTHEAYVTNGQTIRASFYYNSTPDQAFITHDKDGLSLYNKEFIYIYKCDEDLICSENDEVLQILLKNQLATVEELKRLFSLNEEEIERLIK